MGAGSWEGRAAAVQTFVDRARSVRIVRSAAMDKPTSAVIDEAGKLAAEVFRSGAGKTDQARRITDLGRVFKAKKIGILSSTEAKCPVSTNVHAGWLSTWLDTGRETGQTVRPDPCLCAIWSGRRDSNSRPSPWQGDALPAEPLPRDYPLCGDYSDGQDSTGLSQQDSRKCWATR